MGALMLAPAAFAAETVQYAYDAAGRLTQADYGGARIDYVYDANGSAPSEARRFLQGESPCRVRTSHPLVPSVGTVEEESHPNDIV
jgi:hypothetical protein